MNFKKREVVKEAICSFIESRAKSVPEYEKILMGGRGFLPVEHNRMFEELNSTQKRLKNAKQEKKYNSIPCKGILAFTFLVIMLIMSDVALFTKLWLAGLIGLVITVCLSIMYVMYNKWSAANKRSGENGNWLYMLELHLRLSLWKIPPIDNDMKNPRCVYVYFDDTDDSEDWIKSKLLLKLQHDLGIKISDKLAHSLQNTESSSSQFQEYSYWRDAVIGPLGNVPLWCFCIIILVGIPGIVVGAIYHIAYTWVEIFSWVGGISTAVGVLYEIYKFCYKNATNMDQTGPDIEANKQSVDVICQLHRVMRNETIFFTLVNFDGTVPQKLTKHIKFFIDYYNQEDYFLRPDTEYHHFYDYSNLQWHCVKSPAFEKLDRFLKSALQNGRLVNSTHGLSVISENAINFLFLISKINDAHNTLSSIEILRTVCTRVLIDYSNFGTYTVILNTFDDTLSLNMSSHLSSEINLGPRDFESLELDNRNTGMWIAHITSTSMPQSKRQFHVMD